ncbi:MAG: PAS domain S-box protein [Candidatus Moraniibacteriota bacterium]|nr:MAG: PAS domain S-box protein [Candidatus Moranbacteria bacterium]
MNLRIKVFLMVGSAFLVLFFVVYSVLSTVLLREFRDIEKQSVVENVRRAHDALQSKIDELGVKVSDWGQWDDTYEFVEDQNEEYLTANLQDSALALLNIQFVVITDAQGKILFKKEIGIETDEEVPFSPDFESYIETHRTLTQHTDSQSLHSGIVPLGEKTLAVVARAITSSDGTAPVHGTIIFAFTIDDQFQKKISDTTHLTTHLLSYREAESQSDFLEFDRDQETFGDVLEVIPQETDEIVRGYMVVAGIDNESALVIRVELPRDVYREGKEGIRLFSKIMFWSAVFITAVVLLLFEWLVLRKLFMLKEGTVKIRQYPDEERFLTLPKTKDEFHTLAEEINHSLNQLYAIRSKLEFQRDELQKFQLAAEKSFDHIVITDIDGKVLYANHAAEILTGYSKEEMIGNTPALWGKQMPKEFYDTFWRTLKEEKSPYAGELTNKRKDGTKYLSSLRAMPILDEKGAVRYFVGIERDITDERKSQLRVMQHAAELEKANDRIAVEKARAEHILQMLRSIGEGVFATDEKQHIIFMNEQAEAISGKSIEGLKKNVSSDIFVFRVKRGGVMGQVFVSRTALQMKHTFIFPPQTFLVREEKEIPVSGACSPIWNKNREIIGTVTVFQDVTKKHELDQMKDMFLSVAAHQLRTPLGSMRWSMELLLGGDFGKIPKKAQEAIEHIYENSQRMIVLVNDLLNVSRIDQDHSYEKQELVDLRPLLQEVVETMLAEAKKRKIKLEAKFPEQSFSLRGVSRHLYEAFQNLVSNSIKYSNAGGKVQVELKRENGQCVVTVADTGIGIPKESQSKVFSKFFRAKNAVHKETEGSGLGLSVVKSYVEESKGTISFVSEENKGTVFTVIFPCKRT